MKVIFSLAISLIALNLLAQNNHRMIINSLTDKHSISTNQDDVASVDMESEPFSGTFIDLSGHNGKVTQQRSYKDGQPHGAHIRYNGDYVGEVTNYQNGIPVGRYYKFRGPGIMLLKGQFKNGKKHGKWVHYDTVDPKRIQKILYYENGEFVKKS